MRLHSKKYLLLLLPSLIYVQGCAALTDTAALQQLRADYTTLQQLKTEFDQSLKGGKLSDRETADFKTWIRQLQDQVAEDCLAVSGNASTVLPVDPPCEKILAGYSIPADIDIKGESTEAEETARMLEQFNGSLGEFDERLLREQDRVKSRTPRTVSAGGASGGGAGDGQTEGTGNGDTEKGKGANDSGQKEQAGNQSGKQSEKGRRTANSETGTPTKSSSGEKSTAPKDIPDGRNDDVIARQLREAAEKESDPELKKKLWDEYRRYKSGSR
ncbi:MAG: hypothetical protein BMS9Abin25_1364 [Gammaproteobacteria bacterium]|nr:MAG: hypothetical protein BMS9Abin25_1364 [Gammaproteobacteria bacterium]